MNIVLFASDKKKELMSDFCNAYSGILAKHNLFATGTTGELLKRTTSLNIMTFLAGKMGGMEQITTRIRYDEIDLVIGLLDDDYQSASTLLVAEVIKACDMMNVPLSTNIGTAEILVQGLHHGDLEWRDILKKR